jgi:hypothetical protein
LHALATAGFDVDVGTVIRRITIHLGPSPIHVDFDSRPLGLFFDDRAWSAAQ